MVQLYEKPRKDKSIEAEARLVVCMGLGVENVLKFNDGDSCTTLYIYYKKTTELYT